MPRRLTMIAVAALAVACGGPSSPGKPHLVLITADSLRADHLSGAGYSRPTSPTLDAFAEHAWNFRQAVSVIPKTAPSFATVFTGRHPREHGVTQNFARMPDSAPVLAETLRAAGYQTAAFVSNPALRKANGFDRGFDTYAEISRDAGVKQVLARYLEWSASTNWDKPTFLWIHFIDPHGPYTPDAEIEARFLQDEWAADSTRVPNGYDVGATKTPNKVLGAVPRYQQRSDGDDLVAHYIARYDAEIHSMDAAFGRVIEDLTERGRIENAAIVFTSDHGESLGEHNYFFEHGWFVHDATLQIPLFIRTPGQSGAVEVESQVSNLDLRPTLLGLVGVDDPDPGEGRNLLGGPEASPANLLVENGDAYPSKTFGIRNARWKYLLTDGKREQLFDLTADPKEIHDRITANPTVRDNLRAELEKQLESYRRSALSSGGTTRDSDETLERLRSLGYVR